MQTAATRQRPCVVEPRKVASHGHSTRAGRSPGPGSAVAAPRPALAGHRRRSSRSRSSVAAQHRVPPPFGPARNGELLRRARTATSIAVDAADGAESAPVIVGPDGRLRPRRSRATAPSSLFLRRRSRLRRSCDLIAGRQRRRQRRARRHPWLSRARLGWIGRRDRHRRACPTVDVVGAGPGRRPRRRKLDGPGRIHPPAWLAARREDARPGVPAWTRDAGHPRHATRTAPASRTRIAERRRRTGLRRRSCRRTAPPPASCRWSPPGPPVARPEHRRRPDVHGIATRHRDRRRRPDGGRARDATAASSPDSTPRSPDAPARTPTGRTEGRRSRPTEGRDRRHAPSRPRPTSDRPASARQTSPGRDRARASLPRMSVRDLDPCAWDGSTPVVDFTVRASTYLAVQSTRSVDPATRRQAGPAPAPAGGAGTVRRPGTRSAPATIGRMPHRVTLIPGDGIGPELAEATRRVLDASGVAFEWEVVDAGEAVMAQYGTPLPEHVLESIRRNRVALKGPITTPVGGGFRSVNVTLRQVLGLYANLRPARSHQGPRDALRERRPRDRPREHRGPVRGHRAHGRPRRRGEHQDHHPRGVGADRPVRLRVRRRQRPAQGHGRAQGQHHEALGRPVPRELPDDRRRLRRPGRVRGPDRRQHVHAARPEARAVRRHGAAEPVRRHRERPVRGARRRAGGRARARTSGPRRRSSSRSTARRPSTPA